jgi:ribosomal-protein-alanine N-acetyltransferase
MRIPFLPLRQREFYLLPLDARDLPSMAEIHQEDFSRPWSEEEFATLLGQDGVFGFSAREVGHGDKPPVGFVLTRLAADEAEILTIAVDRAHRRLGVGWQLMDAVLRDLHARRTAALFLEVDETNAPAIALYRRLGFIQVGRRANYYANSEGPAGALVMRRDLG